MSKERRNRSSNGCLTCRKRRKKCDELAYPTCQNCDKKGLECSWSEKTVELHKSMNNVKYFGDDDKKHKKRGRIREEVPETVERVIDIVSSEATNSPEPIKPTIHSKPIKHNEPSLPIEPSQPIDFHESKVQSEIPLNIRLPDILKHSNYKTDKYDFDFGTVEEVNIDEYIDFHDKKSFIERIALQQDIVDD